MSNKSLHISVKVWLFLHTFLVRLLPLVTTSMISLPFNRYLQDVKITEGLFWIKGWISASIAQEHGMPSPLGASLAAVKCSFYLSQGGGKLKALFSHRAKKPKNKRWESLADLLWYFSRFFPPCFLFACTENGQLNSSTFLGGLSLELGIKLGDIWDFQVLPTFFFEVTSRQTEKGQVVDEGYFCCEMLNFGFFFQKLFLLL